MIRYFLFMTIALSLLACPSKPRRRPPTLPVVKAGGDSTAQPGIIQASIKDGIYFALQSSEVGYQPQVLQVTNKVIIPLPSVEFSYNKATPYQVSSPEQLNQQTFDLANADGAAINLLLAFNIGVDSYCVTFPLTQVIQHWLRFSAVYEINQKLQQTKAQPVDVSGNKGKLEDTGNGGRQCSTL